ncbi:hypothetical protein [Thermomonospora echinospora]|uniref:hypothetical protein n=1 Tax=Thermomonospora echinospora TaxID=1992 RepID=UPI0011B01951|nr:hypothetical protein [Thermomonospora echinospora]
MSFAGPAFDISRSAPPIAGHPQEGGRNTGAAAVGGPCPLCGERVRQTRQEDGLALMVMLPCGCAV